MPWFLMRCFRFDGLVWGSVISDQRLDVDGRQVYIVTGHSAVRVPSINHLREVEERSSHFRHLEMGLCFCGAKKECASSTSKGSSSAF